MRQAGKRSARARGRVGRWVLSALVTAVAAGAVASTVSYAPAIDVRFVDRQGRPLQGVWIAYRYRGSRFNFVDSLSYERRGALVRSGVDGRLRVPGFLHLHRLLDGGLRPELAWVYDPATHNVSRPLSLSPRVVPERFEIRTDPTRVVLVDQSASPNAWVEMLLELRSLGWSGRLSEPQRNVLRRALRQELEALLSRYGDTRRSPPAVPQRARMSTAEREAVDQQIGQDLARFPTYGDYLRRFFQDERR